MKKAYVTEACGIKALVAAETRGKAVNKTLLSANDVGFNFQFTDFKVKRVKRFDAWAQTDDAKSIYDPDYIAKREGIL